MSISKRYLYLHVAVVMELVVRGQGDESSPSSTEGEEDLSGSIQPHLATESNQYIRKFATHLT